MADDESTTVVTDDPLSTLTFAATIEAPLDPVDQAGMDDRVTTAPSPVADPIERLKTAFEEQLAILHQEMQRIQVQLPTVGRQAVADLTTETKALQDEIQQLKKELLEHKARARTPWFVRAVLHTPLPDVPATKSFAWLRTKDNDAKQLAKPMPRPRYWQRDAGTDATIAFGSDGGVVFREAATFLVQISVQLNDNLRGFDGLTSWFELRINDKVCLSTYFGDFAHTASYVHEATVNDELRIDLKPSNNKDVVDNDTTLLVYRLG